MEVGREEVRAEHFINLILKLFSLIYARFYFIKLQTGKSYKNHTSTPAAMVPRRKIIPDKINPGIDPIINNAIYVERSTQ